jgi:hypothetical protein
MDTNKKEKSITLEQQCNCADVKRWTLHEGRLPYLKHSVLQCTECGRIYLACEYVSNWDWRDDHDEYEEIRYKISKEKLMEILNDLKQGKS